MITLTLYQQRHIQNKVQREKQQKEMLFGEIPLTHPRKRSHSPPQPCYYDSHFSLSSRICMYSTYKYIQPLTLFSLLMVNITLTVKNLKESEEIQGIVMKTNQRTWLGNNFTKMHSFPSASTHQLTVVTGNAFLKYLTWL